MRLSILILLFLTANIPFALSGINGEQSAQSPLAQRNEALGDDILIIEFDAPIDTPSGGITHNFGQGAGGGLSIVSAIESPLFSCSYPY